MRRGGDAEAGGSMVERIIAHSFNIPHTIALALAAFLFVIPLINAHAASSSDCVISSGTTKDTEAGWGLVPQDLGGAFIASCSGQITEVVLRASKNGSPADSTNVRIETDAGNVPSNIVLGTSDNSTPGALMASTTYTFTNPVPVTAGTKYWIVPNRTGARDNHNFYDWQFTYGGTGVWAYSDPNPQTWLGLSRTAIFSITIVPSAPCPSSQAAGSISLITCNGGTIESTTSGTASTGGNAAAGSQGGNGGMGGTITTQNGTTTNGGTSAGSGGLGGSGARGGVVRTGSAVSQATTKNNANGTVIRIAR